jgi:hypothetical protein
MYGAQAAVRIELVNQTLIVTGYTLLLAAKLFVKLPLSCHLQG